MSFAEAGITPSSSGFHVRNSVPGSLWLTRSLTRICFPVDTDAVLAGIPPCTGDVAKLGHSTGCRPRQSPLLCSVSRFPVFLRPEDFPWMLSVCQSASCIQAVSLRVVTSKLAGETKQRRIKPHSSHCGMDVRIQCSGWGVVLAQMVSELYILSLSM